LVRALQFLYSDFSILDHPEFVDFHVRVDRPKGIHRWWHPQAQFFLDGDSPFNCLALGLAVPLFEWGMNWCIVYRAHHFLIFHSAVVEREGRALLLMARPGLGKSTLCAALIHRGWRLLSDELALVNLENCLIAPLPRPVGLKNQSIPVIKGFAPEAALSPEWHDTHKGKVVHMRPPVEAVRRENETALPGWIIFLTYEAGAPTRLEAVQRSRAFLRLADCSFNYSMLGELAFESMARLIDLSACYEFTYGNLAEAVERLGGLKPPAGH
jgi:HprK-related kinase A